MTNTNYVFAVLGSAFITFATGGMAGKLSKFYFKREKDWLNTAFIRIAHFDKRYVGIVIVIFNICYLK